MKSVCIAALVLLFLAPLPCPAAFEAARTGARQMALGGSALAMRGDLGAGTANPAGLAGLRGLSLAAWASPGMFGIEGLNGAGFAAGLPVGGIPAAVQVSSLGFHEYREMTVSLSTAALAGDDCALGARLNYALLSIGGYGSTALPTVDIGMTIVPAPGCGVGFVLTNITAARIGAAGESLPLTLAIGCCYAPASSGLSVCVACSREVLSPLSWSCGVEYAPVPDFTLRAGVATEPSLLCAGFALSLAPFTLEYAVTHHWQLGETHCLSLSVAFE